jgi:dihydrofolate reductase
VPEWLNGAVSKTVKGLWVLRGFESHPPLERLKAVRGDLPLGGDPEMSTRRLTLHMTTTVDGFIAKPDGTLWESFPWPEGMQAFTNDFFRRVDTAVYGRLTYETIVPWWHDIAVGKSPPDVAISEREVELANILEDIHKVVFSRTMSGEAQDVVVLDGDVAGHVTELKEQPGGAIVLHAGGGLVAELAQAGLIDEYMLFVSPAAIGVGKPLFGGLQNELSLRLLETREFNSAFTLLRYEQLTAHAGRRDPEARS